MKSGKKKFVSSFTEALKADLKDHIGDMRHVTNGAGLHSMVLSITEKSLIELALAETKGNQSEASKLLGLNRNTLRRKIGSLEINLKKIAKTAHKA